MRVLFLSSMALFKDTRFGGAKRLFYFARELERRAELSLVCVDGCREWPSGSVPPGEFRQSLYLDLGGRKSLARRTSSLPVDIDEEVARHRGSVEAFLGDRSFDATLLAFPLSLSFLGKGWDDRMGRKVYLEDDLLIEAYRGEAEGEVGLLRKAKGRLRLKQAGKYFRTKLAGASAFVCISREEAAVAKGAFPGLSTPVLKYGLPLEDYPCLPPGDPSVLGFIGNYRHAPNLDAAAWAVGSLFPALTAAMPGVRLVLAGRDIPESLRRSAAALPGLRLMENVGDLADFYGSIGVFLNPIRQGRGLRTKVVEAAAFGRPVLSTPLGTEGLEEMSLGTWETPDQLIVCLRALQDRVAYRSAAETGRRSVEGHYSTEALGAALLEILRP